MNPFLKERFKELVQDICEEQGFHILALETDTDHVHLFLNALPSFSPADILAKIKGGTSKIIRDEFSELKGRPSLWTRSYFVSTARNVSNQTIKRYVESQKTRS